MVFGLVAHSYMWSFLLKKRGGEKRGGEKRGEERRGEEVEETKRNIQPLTTINHSFLYVLYA